MKRTYWYAAMTKDEAQLKQNDFLVNRRFDRWLFIHNGAFISTQY